MSESNADPSWSLEDASQVIKEMAGAHLGQAISDDSVLRLLLILQTTMDVSLAMTAELNLPVPEQATIAETAHHLSHDLIAELLATIGKMNWRIKSSDG